MRTVCTIGYESATVPDFLDALTEGGVQLVADIRAVAGSRRPGFAKTRLAGNLKEVDIDYIHLRGLGTPSDGRAAARGGDYSELRRIYLEHLGSEKAQQDFDMLLQLIDSGRRVCLLCYEAEPEHCHRSMVADALVERAGVTIEHLRPELDRD